MHQCCSFSAPKKPTQTINNLTIFSCQCCFFYLVSRIFFVVLFWLIVIWWFCTCLLLLALSLSLPLAISCLVFASLNFAWNNTKNAYKYTLCMVYHLFQIVQLNICMHTHCSCSRKRATTTKSKHKMTTYVSFWKWMKSHNEFDIFCKKNTSWKMGFKLIEKTLHTESTVGVCVCVCLCDIYNGMC